MEINNQLQSIYLALGGGGGDRLTLGVENHLQFKFVLCFLGGGYTIVVAFGGGGGVDLHIQVVYSNNHKISMFESNA